MTQVKFQGSDRSAPENARLVSAAPKDEMLEVSIYVKPADDTDDLLTQGPQQSPSVAFEREARGAHRADPASLAAVIAYAAEKGLAVEKHDPARRLVKVRGTVAQMEAAFGTKLNTFSGPQGAFRARTGSLSLPKGLAGHVEAILGLDTRPMAKPRLKLAMPHVVGGHLPNQIARLYDFPKNKTGKGQCIAIIELGGGYRDSDTQMAFAAMNLPAPKVIPISVSGGANSPGDEADGEVALDIQVAGAAAPDATLAVYFAPNTTQGFVDAITRAVHDQQNKPSVISISWGSAEENWTGQGLSAMNSAFRDAAKSGVTVLAASGDNLATDSMTDSAAHVDFPASSPYVIGCGGTLLDVAVGSIKAETVWNSQGSGTGGGVSAHFPPPAYQQNAGVPNSVSSDLPGRGVPDVAADADPASGYRIVLNGLTGPIGGTSAVAPLLAGLVALVNEGRQPVGFIHPLLYGNPGAFRDITQGDNRDGGLGYDARQGWDACTGLGVPVGSKILSIFEGPPAAAENVAPPVAEEAEKPHAEKIEIIVT